MLPAHLGAVVHSGSIRDKQLRMLEYAEKANACIESTQPPSKLPKGVVKAIVSARSSVEHDSLRSNTQAIEWVATRPPDIVAAKRECMITAIEEIDLKTRQSGLCNLWFGDADEHTRAVAGTANGYLFQTLLRASGYNDVECVNLLREGGLCKCSKTGQRRPPILFLC